ncbi:MAG: type 4a pilus biogenesis protein PilO [Gemmatimonadetes bacterium]|nr:type 4a pilus biogenesis protein PilO [Gemmatimonadota bacterium]
MAGLPPMTERDRNILVVGVFAFLAAGAYWYFLYNDKQTELDTLEASIAKLDTANMKAKKLLQRGKLEELRAETERSQKSLELMRQLVPTGNEVPALLDQVSSAAKAAGLEVSAVKPEPISVGAEFDTYRYSISVVGPYHAVASFLASVGSLTRIMAPVNVSVDLSTQANKAKVTRKGEAMLSTTFELQTYVAHTSAPATPAKPAGKA